MARVSKPFQDLSNVAWSVERGILGFRTVGLGLDCEVLGDFELKVKSLELSEL